VAKVVLAYVPLLNVPLCKDKELKTPFTTTLPFTVVADGL